MASMSTEDKLAYVCTVLKNTALTQPDYKAVAAELGLADANTAQKKFKAIIESIGFKLVKQQVEGGDGSVGSKRTERSARATPATSQTRKTATKPAPKKQTTKRATATTAGSRAGRGKKRKIDETLDSGNESNEQIKPENAEANHSDSDLEVIGEGRARSATVKEEPTTRHQAHVDNDPEDE